MFDPETKVLMYDGNMKLVGRVCKGDLLMGSKSNPVEVMDVVDGESEMCTLVPKKGDSIRVSTDHEFVFGRWARRKENKQRISYFKEQSMSPAEILTRGSSFLERSKLVRTDADFDYKAVPFDPYFLGL